jgi:ATP-dependent DNA ligase
MLLRFGSSLAQRGRFTQSATRCRKKAPRKIIPARSSRLLYVDHVDGPGEDLFRLVCERDLEGIVAKLKRGAYISDDQRTSAWLKIKNRSYTQALGREKLFEKRSE